LIELAIELNVPCSLVPRVLTTPMMATEMPAAMRPYSIAVAPDSFLRNATTLRKEGLGDDSGSP
jgi:hypothetical protein